MNATLRRVLLVEDEVLVALDTQDVLESAGYAVLGPATTLESALALADEPLDAAVLDVSLGGVYVWPVAEALTRRHVPLVLLTGFGAALDVPEAFVAMPRLGKPLDGGMLVGTLAGLLR